MLTSACYRRCIHAFSPHISMQIFTHNLIPSKRIRSSLTFFCSIILCVVNSSLQKQREKNVMRVWHTIICREMQCHMQETRIYWEMWYLCVWHIRIRTNKTDVKFYQLAAIDELLLVRCILSLYFVFYLFWAGISTWEFQESPIKRPYLAFCMASEEATSNHPQPSSLFLTQMDKIHCW
jgi:hypothetical protein